MDDHPKNGECTPAEELKETYALVAYIPDPIAEFLNDLRLRLDPGSEPHAHVTLLPPRQLAGTADEARRQLNEYTRSLTPFTLSFDGVEVFEETNVVFLALGGNGNHVLHNIHEALNTGALAFDEPFEYHPHVTIVQFQPAEQVTEKALETRASWAAYAGPRQFRVERITFVKHMGGNNWLDLDCYDLS